MKIGAPHVAKFDRWTPRQLMNGSLALWYDFTDQSTLFTDTALSTRVTVLSDAIGSVYDKSGNACHLTQSTAANCPLWSSQNGVNGALFDGVTDVMIANSGANAIFRNQSAAAIFALIYPTSVAGSRTIMYVGNNSGSVRTSFQINPFGASNLGIRARRLDGDTSTNFVTSVSSTANVMQTVGFVWDTSSAICNVYTNGALLSSGALLTAGLFSDTDSSGVSVGATPTGGDLFSGSIFEIIAVRGINHTQIQLLETYFRRKAGL